MFIFFFFAHFTSRECESEHEEKPFDLLNEMNETMKTQITIPKSLAFIDTITTNAIDKIKWNINEIPLLINHGSRYSRLR